jgi:hypothetical protein
MVLIEIAFLTVIYSIWIIVLVHSMISSEQISLTVATLPFLITFPIALIIAASLEITIPGIFLVDVVVTVVIGILIFVRWIMALVGE